MKHRMIQRIIQPTRAASCRGFMHFCVAQCTGWGVA